MRKFVYDWLKDIILVWNLHEHYEGNIDEYLYYIFADNLYYNDLEKTIQEPYKCDFDMEEVILRYAIPTIFEQFERRRDIKDIIKCLINEDYIEIFNEFAILLGYSILNEYFSTARRIAISKLKRNKIVNNGILLKISMRDCGLF